MHSKIKNNFTVFIYSTWSTFIRHEKVNRRPSTPTVVPESTDPFKTYHCHYHHGMIGPINFWTCSKENCSASHRSQFPPKHYYSNDHACGMHERANDSAKTNANGKQNMYLVAHVSAFWNWVMSYGVIDLIINFCKHIPCDRLPDPWFSSQFKANKK